MLAGQYASLERHAGFINLLEWLKEEVVKRESAAAKPPEGLSYDQKWARLISWQESKQVLMLIENKIDDAKRYVDEETQNARAIDTDRASRKQW